MHTDNRNKVICKRRTLLGYLSGAAIGSGVARSQRPLGINLYSVRENLAKQPAQTLEKLAQIGYKHLEVRPANLTQLGQAMKHNGLQPVHMMIEAPIITGKWDIWRDFASRMAARMNMKAPPPPGGVRPALEHMIDLAVKHGLTGIGVSYLLPEERPEPDGWERYAAMLNKAGEQCKKAGIHLYHHNHSVEVAGKAGNRPIDRLAKHTQRDLVGFEIDVFWAAVGGVDPAKLISSMRGRVFSLHLKDRAPGTPVSHDIVDLKPEWFREIGEGNLNMPSILQAAKQARVRYLFVEQDYSKRDALESARVSYEALRKLAV
jgi:sugar phosphate isomerase/epimerase